MAAAEASTSATSSAPSKHGDIGSNAGCRCFCRRCGNHEQGQGLGLGLGLLCQCRHHHRRSPSSSTMAYASWLLFTASVALVLVKSGRRHHPEQRRYWPSTKQHRGFQGQRKFYEARSYMYSYKKVRRPRWEWRPVTRRSSGSQTSEAESFSVVVGPETGTEVVQAPASAPAQLLQSVDTADPGLSLDEFPSLSRDMLNSSGRDHRNQQQQQQQLHTSMGEAKPEDPFLPPPPATAGAIELKQETVNGEQQPPLTRKQKKYLRKKQKKLKAASQVLHISSLPILKSWKSSSSKCRPWEATAVEHSKSFGPLGSSSPKSIFWTYSPPRADWELRSEPHQEGPPALQEPDPSALTLKPIWTLNGKPRVVNDISTCESLNSYLEWMDDETSSSQRSQSEPEEIEVEVAYTDSEFESISDD